MSLAALALFTFETAMNRSTIATSALALSLCVAALSVIAPKSARAADPLPDARMLAARPFQFKADSAIFSPMPSVPSDSRIFSPRKVRPNEGEEKFSMRRAQNIKQL
jgi:hypothetical protein